MLCAVDLTRARLSSGTNIVVSVPVQRLSKAQVGATELVEAVEMAGWLGKATAGLSNLNESLKEFTSEVLSETTEEDEGDEKTRLDVRSSHSAPIQVHCCRVGGSRCPVGGWRSWRRRCRTGRRASSPSSRPTSSSPSRSPPPPFSHRCPLSRRRPYPFKSRSLEKRLAEVEENAAASLRTRDLEISHLQSRTRKESEFEVPLLPVPAPLARTVVERRIGCEVETLEEDDVEESGGRSPGSPDAFEVTLLQDEVRALKAEVAHWKGLARAAPREPSPAPGPDPDLHARLLAEVLPHYLACNCVMTYSCHVVKVEELRQEVEAAKNAAEEQDLLQAKYAEAHSKLSELQSHAEQTQQRWENPARLLYRKRTPPFPGWPRRRRGLGGRRKGRRRRPGTWSCSRKTSPRHVRRQSPFAPNWRRPAKTQPPTLRRYPYYTCSSVEPRGETNWSLCLEEAEWLEQETADQAAEVQRLQGELEHAQEMINALQAQHNADVAAAREAQRAAEMRASQLQDQLEDARVIGVAKRISMHNRTRDLAGCESGCRRDVGAAGGRVGRCEESS